MVTLFTSKQIRRGIFEICQQFRQKMGGNSMAELSKYYIVCGDEFAVLFFKVF